MKGTDHKCSLEPSEFKQLIDNIKTLEISLGQAIKIRQPCEIPCYDKLGKTLVYRSPLYKRHILQTTDLEMKVASTKGIENINQVIGKTLGEDVKTEESVQAKHFF